jgi:hypothetical protein
MKDGDAGVAAVADLPIHDFNIFLHELRTRAIREMPPGAKTFLSGGCAGLWYFDWIKQNYPGTITRHVGLEAYQARPDGLPAEVDWIPTTLGRMDGVGTEEVDLVFAGQTVEHIWPEEMTAFLAEAHRVLRRDGWVVLDSLNRRITRAAGWIQREHTVEYNTDEIVELLDLAGFEEVRVRGVWLCYDRDGHRHLPLDPGVTVPGWDYKRRVALASDRPEDCFVWWVEARRGGRRPDRTRLLARCQEIYDAVWPGVASRSSHLVGRLKGTGRNQLVYTAQGEAGFAKYGPHIPLRRGRHETTFAVGCPADVGGVSADEVVCTLDVCSAGGKKTLARCQVAYGEVCTGRLKEFVLPFQLHETEFFVESRILVTGRAPLFARFQSDFCEVTPETERSVVPSGHERVTATDLIWKELDILQVRYNMLGTLVAQLNGK